MNKFGFLISPPQCFPDRFVRRDVKQMIVSCPRGCQWEDMVAELEAHLKACNFISNLCGVVLTPDQIGTHTHTVSKAKIFVEIMTLDLPFSGDTGRASATF